MSILDSMEHKYVDKLWEKFANCFESEFAEEFLQTLLNLMSLMFVLNSEYRKNIRNFDGKYQFLSEDGQITIAAVFDDSHMEVVEKVIDSPHITITFRNGRTLLNFLISPKQDILGSMLRQDVKTNGNLNYLYRFGFMAKQLQLMMPLHE